MTTVHLARQALRDIREIETYSIDVWGKRVAAEYLQSIEDALNLLRQNPGLLKAKTDCGDSLCFYRVRQHFLVCTIIKRRIFVLTVKHGSMDLPNRIAELEPHLAREAEMLHRKLSRK